MMQSKTYTVNYHLAQGVMLQVGKVSEEDVEKIKIVLSKPNHVINVSGRDTNKIQFVPVRNILAVEAIEE